VYAAVRRLNRNVLVEQVVLLPFKALLLVGAGIESWALLSAGAGLLTGLGLCVFAVIGVAVGFARLLRKSRSFALIVAGEVLEKQELEDLVFKALVGENVVVDVERALRVDEAGIVSPAADRCSCARFAVTDDLYSRLEEGADIVLLCSAKGRIVGRLKDVVDFDNRQSGTDRPRSGGVWKRVD
jgi:hypothetical protein